MARGAVLNAALHGRRLRRVTQLDSDARQLLDRALEQLSLSARGYDRVLRVARTIADLDCAEQVSASHLGEALQFRGVD
jgi:magnesium chelatase family protein